MKFFLSRYFWIWSIILETMLVGSLLIAFLVEAHPFENVIACALGGIAVPIFTKKLFLDNRNLFMTAKIDKGLISSKLFGKACCTICCNTPVYFLYFRDSVEMGPPERPYIAISNSPISFSPSKSKLLSFDRQKVILFLDTEQVRAILASCIGSDNRREQNTPPPADELRKSPESSPKVTQKVSSDDPPPFTGKWNGRF